MNNVLLIQFAKWPLLGKVKTRLAKTLGDSGALAAHQQLTMSVLENLTTSGVGTVELWIDQQRHNTEGQIIIEACEQQQVAVLLQQGSDLGERMFHALTAGLTRFDKVIIVGSDCPSVDKKYLENAINALDKTELVLGPAEDGGYVLIGARKLKPNVLENIEWGSASVLSATVANIASLKLTHTLLDVRWDVDEIEDYERWKKQKR